jgi:hypothetical protein
MRPMKGGPTTTTGTRRKLFFLCIIIKTAKKRTINRQINSLLEYHHFAYGYECVLFLVGNGFFGARARASRSACEKEWGSGNQTRPTNPASFRWLHDRAWKSCVLLLPSHSTCQMMACKRRYSAVWIYAGSELTKTMGCTALQLVHQLLTCFSLCCKTMKGKILVKHEALTLHVVNHRLCIVLVPVQFFGTAC